MVARDEFARIASMPVSSIPAVRIGQIVAERYSVQRLLGEGAAGAVFAAEDLQQGRLVALKVLKASALSNRHALERFRREIHATMRIECEHIVRTLGVDYLGDETPFMVMEYLDARDLSRIIAEDGPLPFDKAIGFALQVCLALAHAHRLGIVHRDIKPANLLLVRQPNGREVVKVLDFGISKITSNALLTVPQKLTGKSVRLGSPMYMSPEQRTLGREVDERADIWALGITLFEMLAGVTPFDSNPLSIRGELEAPSSVPSLSRHRPGLPHGLDAIVARCLQRMPERRFQNVAELASALSPYAAPGMARLPWEVTQALGRPRASSRPPRAAAPQDQGALLDGIGPGTTLGPTIAPGPATVRVDPRHRAGRVGWLVGSLSLCAAIAAGVAWTLHQTEAPPRVAAHAYARIPIPAAWAHPARSWEQGLLRHPDNWMQLPAARSERTTVTPSPETSSQPAPQPPPIVVPVAPTTDVGY